MTASRIGRASTGVHIPDQPDRVAQVAPVTSTAPVPLAEQITALPPAPEALPTVEHVPEPVDPDAGDALDIENALNDVLTGQVPVLPSQLVTAAHFGRTELEGSI